MSHPIPGHDYSERTKDESDSEYAKRKYKDTHSKKEIAKKMPSKTLLYKKYDGKIERNIPGESRQDEIKRANEHSKMAGVVTIARGKMKKKLAKKEGKWKEWKKENYESRKKFIKEVSKE